jgi:hypothetical protein
MSKDNVDYMCAEFYCAMLLPRADQASPRRAFVPSISSDSAPQRE